MAVGKAKEFKKWQPTHAQPVNGHLTLSSQSRLNAGRTLKSLYVRSVTTIKLLPAMVLPQSNLLLFIHAFHIPEERPKQKLGRKDMSYLHFLNF